VIDDRDHAHDASERRRRRDDLRWHPRRVGLERVLASFDGDCLFLEIFFVPPWPGVTKRAVPEHLAATHVAIERDDERLAIEAVEWNVDPFEGVVHVTFCGVPAPAAGEVWRLRIVDILDIDGEFCVVDIEFVERARRPRPAPPPMVARAREEPPLIDYLTLDYDGFRRTILDRIRQRVPSWRDTSEADLGVVLAELLAYSADRLSYWRDGVGTESYLATARLRESARRHARLLDYQPGEGCTPRTWVQVTVDDDGVVLPAGTALLTRLPHHPTRIAVEDYRDRNLSRVFQDAEIFETIEPATLFQSHDLLFLDCGSGGESTSLEAGATSACLRGRVSSLRAGDVLVFEDIERAAAGAPDASHVVRLDRAPVVEGDDDGPSTRIHWHSQDELPREFPLQRRSEAGGWSENLTIVRGNVVLVEFGRTIAGELLPVVKSGEAYRPELAVGPLLYGAPPADLEQASASALTAWDQQRAEPQIQLVEYLAYASHGLGAARPPTWHARPDLLMSRAWDRDFVVDSSDPATLRFGDGEHGRRPTTGASFAATYRVGDLRRSTVAAGALRHVVTDDERILEVRNVVPTPPSAMPEGVNDIRVNAPQAHLAQMRCVTGGDYEQSCRALPGVRDAAAHLHRDADHTRVVLHVERDGGQRADRRFRRAIRRALEPLRLIGASLHIRPPEYAPVFLELRVAAESSAVRSSVERAVHHALVGPARSDRPEAFFAPGRFVFGEPVLAGRLIAAVMAVRGVADAVIVRLTWAMRPSTGPVPERLTPGPYEIARLDNDPARSETGLLRVHVHGGRA
jgi:hypothetical protein